MNVLIIGSNGLLARTYLKENHNSITGLYATATNKNSLSSIEVKAKIYSLDFNSRESINTFFENEFGELDLILFCASPFEGTIKNSSYDDLSIWSNAYDVAIKVACLASEKLTSNGKLIFIGSVVGYQGQIAASCVPYSVFKGSLSLLVEGYNKEVSNNAYYINLGGFREKETDDCLSVKQVVRYLDDIVLGKIKDSHINVVSESDRVTYGL